MDKRLYHQTWREGLTLEITFWDEFLSGKIDQKALQERMQDRPLQWPTAYYLNKVNENNLSVLDLGSGPISALGNLFKGKKIELIAIDPLASHYKDLMDKHNIKLSYELIQGEGEKLSEVFPPNRFHAINCSNALDHAYDPIICLKESFKVLKAGCYFVGIHKKNEAVEVKYEGLHQWNFDIKWKKLILWNKFVKINVLEEIEDLLGDYDMWKQDKNLIMFALQKKI